MDSNSQFGQLVARCEKISAYTFTNKLLCAESVNNAGADNSVAVFNGAFTVVPKNDRLAVYGDSVMASLLSRDWYHGNLDKGAAWTFIRNEVLSNNFLSKTGFENGLDKCINRTLGTRVVSKRIMVTAVEAILGAVHLDGGDNALRRVMKHLAIVSPYELPVMFRIPPPQTISRMYRSAPIYSR